MQPSMHTKLEQLAHRLEEIDRELAAEEAARDMNRFRALGRERSEIEPVVTRFHEYNRACAELAGAQEMLSDPDMKTLAEEEIHAASGRIETLEADLQRLLLPKDPNDDRNIFLEIRAGTGGDESGIFAGDLLRMYMRYAERQRWTTEMISESAVGHGRLQGSDRAHRRQRRVLEVEVRVGRASRPARPGDGVARSHPHLGLHRGGAAGSRRDQRRQDRPDRDPDRRLSRVGRGRPARQQDRVAPCASRTCRPASWSSARTTARSTRTAIAR